MTDKPDAVLRPFSALLSGSLPDTPGALKAFAALIPSRMTSDKRVSVSTVSRWQSGATIPDDWRVPYLAAALKGCSEAEIQASINYARVLRDSDGQMDVTDGQRLMTLEDEVRELRAGLAETRSDLARILAAVEDPGAQSRLRQRGPR